MDSTSRFILKPLIVSGIVGLFLLPSVGHAAREMTDREIAQRISSKMENSRLFAAPPQATCTSGVVTLSGTVADLRLNDQAVMLAEGTRGVTSVIDDIKVGAAAQSDTDIWKNSLKAVHMDPTLRPYDIVPSVRDGIVTLKGRVDSLAESSLASWTVSGVKGVLGIINSIEIIPRNTSDQEITNEVRDELKADPFVSDANLSVTTQKGIVFLSGEIPSLVQRRRIYRDALVSGVVGLDLTGVKLDLRLPNLGPPVKAPEGDVQIQTAAAAAVRLDPRLKREKITIDVNGGRATLSGTVQSLSSQMIADEDVRNTAGVVVVDDRLIVNSKKVRPDSEIMTDVTDMLDLDSLLAPFSISAAVKNGIVTLTGKVDTDYEKWDASEEVALIDGVRKIDNELGLFQPRPKRTSVPDSTIRDTISKDLWSDPNLSPGNDIYVSVTGGKATLQGTARSLAASGEAVEDAFDGGAIAVSNKIKLPGQKSATIGEFPNGPNEIYSFQWAGEGTTATKIAGPKPTPHK